MKFNSVIFGRGNPAPTIILWTALPKYLFNLHLNTPLKIIYFYLSFISAQIVVNLPSGSTGNAPATSLKKLAWSFAFLG